MDGYNLYQNMPINVTETVEIVKQVAANITGIDDYDQFLLDIKDDIQ